MVCCMERLKIQDLTYFLRSKFWIFEVNGDNKDNGTEYSETPTDKKPGFTLKTHGKDSEDFDKKIKTIR